jgi:hypothetical protein
MVELDELIARGRLDDLNSVGIQVAHYPRHRFVARPRPLALLEEPRFVASHVRTPSVRFGRRGAAANQQHDKQERALARPHEQPNGG